MTGTTVFPIFASTPGNDKALIRLPTYLLQDGRLLEACLPEDEERSSPALPSSGDASGGGAQLTLAFPQMSPHATLPMLRQNEG